ncbi:hypothetical protein G6F31_020981 [Rhizopus arrhizus]|nr:hypothetical protein G6F31_020981 [Rhizopus arrhizus]
MAKSTNTGRGPPARRRAAPTGVRAPARRTGPAARPGCRPRRRRPDSPGPATAARPVAGWGTGVQARAGATGPPAWPARLRAGPSSGSTCAGRCWCSGRSGRIGRRIPGGRSRRRPGRTG